MQHPLERYGLPVEFAPANRIVSVAEMQAIERSANAGGHTYAAMMELAGRRVAEAILARYGRVSCLVLAGPGNNGGDGLVCARYLHEAGAPVYVYLWQRATTPEADFEQHYARLLALNIPTAHAADDPDFATLRGWLQVRVVVDALLGTGANRPIIGQLAALLATVHTARHAAAFDVVAVDCASGMNCDSGALDSHMLTPALTVTFACAKRGHYLFPAANAVGDLVVADIGVDPALTAGVRTFALDETTVRAWLPPRPADSHKGAFGKVMLAVGSEAYPGAAYLASAAAGRAGAGLVTVAAIRSVWALVAAKLPEPTYLLLPDAPGPNGAVIAAPAAVPLADVLAGYRALVLGCGLGNTPATQAFVAALLAHPAAEVATVIDADGLNCLAALEQWPQLLPAKCVLTPHPAEMARLCGLTVAQVMADRWALARQMAAAWQCTVLLKGPYTVIAAPDGWLALLPVATAALATAGAGDVLAGVIGGLLAQGMESFAAACVGAWLHAAAGLRCAAKLGVAGIAASDLLPILPHVQQQVREGSERSVGGCGTPSCVTRHPSLMTHDS